jgi:hypothetical protein
VAIRPCHQAIQKLAYILWEMRGRPEGDPEADWIAAEREFTDALNDGRLDGFDQAYVNNTATAGQLRRSLGSSVAEPGRIPCLPQNDNLNPPKTSLSGPG